MIYLIESAAFDISSTEDDIKYCRLLKIGYTKDEERFEKSNRYLSYIKALFPLYMYGK